MKVARQALRTSWRQPSSHSSTNTYSSPWALTQSRQEAKGRGREGDLDDVLGDGGDEAEDVGVAPDVDHDAELVQEGLLVHGAPPVLRLLHRHRLAPPPLPSPSPPPFERRLIGGARVYGFLRTPRYTRPNWPVPRRLPSVRQSMETSC